MNKKFFVAAAFLLLLAANAAAGNLQIKPVSYSPAPASPGGTVTAWVKLKNDSANAAENVKVKVEMGYPLSLQPGQAGEVNLGNVGSQETVTVEYRLLVNHQAVDGSYNIEVFAGEGEFSKRSKASIEVQSRTPKLEVVESSVTRIAPGTVAPASLRIKNVGGSIAKSIVVKTTEDRTVTSTGIVVQREITSLGAASSYIEALEQGQEALVEMRLAVNQEAEQQNYLVPLTIEYYDLNGTARTDTSYLGLEVTAEAEMDAVVDSVEPFAAPGAKAEITIDLFNLGLGDARYVVAELEAEGVEFEEPRQFIGTMEADDFDSFNTMATFSPTVQPGQHPISLKITYKDKDLVERVQRKQLNVKVLGPVEAQAAAGGGPMLIFAGLVSLALQLVGLYVAARFAYRKYKQFRAR